MYHLTDNMLETKSYIEISETNIPNVSRNHPSKVTRTGTGVRASGFYFDKTDLVILKISTLVI